MEGIGAGIAALAFWGFIAAVSLAGIWDAAKKRQVQHETLRRIIDSGKPIDQELIDRLLDENKPRNRQGLRIGAIVVLSLAPGMALLAVFLSHLDARVQLPLLGVAGLLACLGVGLLIASVYDRRAQLEELAASARPSKSP